jgi:Putative stress-responsive transcriptional regulator
MPNDYKKLLRSKTNRTICGVCGGLGEYIGVDPTVVRIIWLIASICSVGTGFVVYLLAAIIIPEE